MKSMLACGLLLFVASWGAAAVETPALQNGRNWIKQDGIEAKAPPVRYFHYDNPELAFTGTWGFVIMGSSRTDERTRGYGRSSEKAGAQVSLDFIGTKVSGDFKDGLLEHRGLMTPDAELEQGVALVTVDGKPVASNAVVVVDGAGNSMVVTSRAGADAPIVSGLKPGLHRLVVTNPGRVIRPGTSTRIGVAGFTVGMDERDLTENQKTFWRYAMAVRGGQGWREQVMALAGKLAAEPGPADLQAIKALYLASRETDELAATLREFRDRPPESVMTREERKYWRPAGETTAYYNELTGLGERVRVVLDKTARFRYGPAGVDAYGGLLRELKQVVADVDACMDRQVRQLPRIVFATGPVLGSCAVPVYISMGNPMGKRWGCDIRVWDPATPQAPAKVIFKDPDAMILDMNLSYDARTVFFSMRSSQDKYWQIHEIGIDGQGLKQITKGDAFNVSPVPLPDGRIAHISSRTRGTHNVCQSGPSTHVYVMNRDGSNPRDLSVNTLSDFGLNLLRDGRLIFTRWEYVDADLGWRQALWTVYPDGRQLQLYFGNTLYDPATFWQAHEIPGRDAVLATFTTHHGAPYGAIGMIAPRLGVEAPRDVGFRWITEEFPVIEDLSPAWSYRDPMPVSECQFLVAYGGGKRYQVCLMDEMGNRRLVYGDPATSCYNPLPVRARPLPRLIPEFTPQHVRYAELPAAPPAFKQSEKVPLGVFYVTDVYRGLEPEVARGRAKSIRIMEQVPKKVNTTWYRAYDQGPILSASTYYVKRCWGYAPVEADGSAYFEAPAGKEIYFQVCDAEGRELRRMTSATQLVPGEVQGCVGCHESRGTVSAPVTSSLATKRAPSPLTLPEWGNAGIIDYARQIQPILDRHCAQCHSGTNPKGGVLLSGGYTRFFNMSYDNLVVRSQSIQVSTDLYLGWGTNQPLVQINHMFPGTYTAHKPLTTGSLVSRLPAYFETAHCRSEVTPSEKRQLHEWIDAMAPYYPTAYSARPGSRGDRDRWGDNAVPRKIADWYKKGFEQVYQKRCDACHGEIHVDGAYEWGGKWSWIDLGTPEWSPALTAHLAKEAGGRGVTEQDFGKLLNSRWAGRRSNLLGRWASLRNDYIVMNKALAGGRKVELFKDTNDPDYQAMLKAIQQGSEYMAQLPEADMPGFVNRSEDKYFK